LAGWHGGAQFRRQNSGWHRRAGGRRLRFGTAERAPDSFAAAPKWLLETLVPGVPATVTATPATSWRDIVRDEVTEGRRNDTLARLAGHLLRRWVDPLVTLEFLLTWNATRCRPPLDESEVFTIVNSIAGRELKRRGSR
jgi:Primase C terminal 1 (PriCT-1)